MDKAGFDRVFAKPVFSRKTPFLSVFACLGQTAEARLGIVVAKRNVRLAVNRNKLKRLIRETFRRQHDQMQGLDIVVIVKKDFASDDAKGLGNLPGIFKMVGDTRRPEAV